MKSSRLFMIGGSLAMNKHSTGNLSPRPVPIPEELREFLEVVHILTEGVENGTYKFPSGEGAILWDDITWSVTGVFCTRMIGFPYENLAEFEFHYSPHFRNGFTEWDFDLTREELAQIARGTVKDLALYDCANPMCGYMSSFPYERCRRCNLKAGAEITEPHAPRVLGICPYCSQFLRTLYAQQCPHCRMDWHDPDHLTTLGGNS